MKHSNIARRLIDWNKPALPAAAGLLLDEFCATPGDLSGAVVVGPGGRVNRRLLEFLVIEADRRGVMLAPPEIITVGVLPELLYAPRLPFADEMTQRLAWATALRQVDRDVLLAAAPSPPASQETTDWLDLADVLRAQHIELAADFLDFANVVDKTRELGEAEESRRWAALRQIQLAYFALLDGLKLWDKQTARLEAIRRNECSIDRRLILLGMVDTNRSIRRMIDQVADRTAAIIFAPHGGEDRFDEHGCLVPASWLEQQTDVAAGRIRLADDPVAQADEAARAIADFNGAYRADEITVGVCDERIVPQIERQLSQCGLPVRWGAGRPLADAGPSRLLNAAAEYLESGRAAQFAALVRHPDVDRWLYRRGAPSNWLTKLDQYQADFLPARLGGKWRGRRVDCEPVKAAYQAAMELLGDLTAGGRDDVDRWLRPIAELLERLYSDRRFDAADPADRADQAAIEKLLHAADEYRGLPVELAPRITAAEATRWLLRAVAGQTVAPPADEGAIELLGWLELPLDDAPGLVIAAFNDGLVPKSVNSDLFLPNQLRRALGLDDNDRRCARDAYALAMISASRPQTEFVVGRRDADDNPLFPSRLLLACDDEELAGRVMTFLQPPAPTVSKPPLIGAVSVERETSAFDVPRPTPLDEPLESLRATDFKSYLACPYRFYLGRILKLATLDDAVDELDPGGFGTLVHEALKQFGADARRHTIDPGAIRDVLNQQLDQLLEENYGTHARAAVAVQVEQARMRLAAFAERQAAWAEQGWRIEMTERPTEEEDAACRLLVDGQPFGIRGRIDRIDRHVETGGWAVFDYKTSEAGDHPHKTHRKRDGDWVDLQLPLYRHLAAVLGVEDDVRLGYIALPKDTARTNFLLAEWTAEELAAADEAAREVIRSVRAGVFWPPVGEPPAFSEEFAAICMDGVFDRPELSDEQP